MTPPTVAVTTPTGNVGRHLVADLLRAGVRPRLLSRRPESLDPRLPELADVVRLDLTDADAVLDATQGVDALYLVVPPTEADDPVAEYERIGRGVARAVAHHRIAHTVLQSSVGAELRDGAGEIDGLARAEVALDEAADEAGVAVTHLRCGFFFTNLVLQLDAVRSGSVPVVLPTDQPMAWVAPRDIAGVAALLLLQHDRTGRRVQAVHGPTDLSWDDALAAVSEAVGREVRAERMPDDAMRSALAGAGLGAGQVEAILGMSTGLRDGFVPEQPRTATTTTETTLGAWAYDVLRPALAQA